MSAQPIACVGDGVMTAPGKLSAFCKLEAPENDSFLRTSTIAVAIVAALALTSMPASGLASTLKLGGPQLRQAQADFCEAGAVRELRSCDLGDCWQAAAALQQAQSLAQNSTRRASSLRTTGGSP